MLEKTIAIVPFTNIGNKVEDEYFSDGITDELLFTLTNVSGIKVASRTSTYYLKNKNLPLKEISETLGVDYILEGSVRKLENVARIAVQLIKIENESSLFSEIYEVKLDNIFEVQTDIASKIAEKLKGAFDPVSYSDSLTKNPKAHDLYLKGNYHWYKYTKKEIEQAINYFNKAIKIEPEFALAYSGLAKSYVILGAVGFSPPKEVFPKAKKAVKKALLINNKLLEPNLSSAWVCLFYDWDIKTTKKYLELCLRSNPNHADIYHLYSKFYFTIGKLAKAEDASLTSIEIDPMVLTQHANLACIYYYMGRYDDALAICERSLEIDASFLPAIEQKGWIYTLLGELDKAIETFKNLRIKSNNSFKSLAGLGYVYARAGFNPESKECLLEIIDAEKENDSSAINFEKAVINVGLRNYDSAYNLIKKCIDNRLGIITYEMLCNPIFHELKAEQRFVELFQQCILSPNGLFPDELSDNRQPSIIQIISGTSEKLLLDPNDLLYIEADDNYCKIFWKEGNTLKEKLLRVTLSQLEQQLKAFSFITRCHKSFIINVKEDYTIDGNLKGYKFKSALSPTFIPVSRQRAKKVIELHSQFHQQV